MFINFFNKANQCYCRLENMSRISSTWFDMFPKYRENAKSHIKKIKSRSDQEIFAPSKINEKDSLEVNRSETELEYSGEIKLKDILTRLQYLAHYNEDEIEIKPRCTIRMNILGKEIKFKLDESKTHDKRGWQILVYDDKGVRPKFDSVMTKLNEMDSCKLARSILKALYTSLDEQTKFELNDCAESYLNAVRMFILLTHIAEAAVPTRKALKEYLKHITGNKFVSHDERNTNLKLKHGRTPMMDKIVRAKLRKCAYLPKFSKEFSEKHFPSQSLEGTRKSRERALEGYEIDHLSDFEDDLPIFSKEFSAEEMPSQSREGTSKSREHALGGYDNDHLSDNENEEDLSKLMKDKIEIKGDSDKK